MKKAKKAGKGSKKPIKKMVSKKEKVLKKDNNDSMMGAAMKKAMSSYAKKG